MKIEDYKKPSIGVVIATYNNALYLRECIESVLRQTYKPSQIIICDDASIDGNQEIVKEYAKKYPNLIESILHKINKGIPKNFNSGLKRIKTDYLCLIAGDDFWDKNKLKFEVERLQHVKAARWCYSGSYLTDSSGKVTKKFVRAYDGSEGNILFYVLSHQMTLRNLLIEKKLLDEVGFFDETLAVFEDWDFKIRLAASAPVAATNKRTNFYRRHTSNISMGDPEKLIRDEIRVYEKHLPLLANCIQSEALNIKCSVESLIAHKQLKMPESRRFVYYTLENVYKRFYPVYINSSKNDRYVIKKCISEMFIKAAKHELTKNHKKNALKYGVRSLRYNSKNTYVKYLTRLLEKLKLSRALGANEKLI